MKKNWIETDRTISKVSEILYKCAKQYNVEIKSLILYGSKARGENRSSNYYEMVLLIENDIETSVYVKLRNTIRIEFLKEKLVSVNLLVYTPDIFNDILYNDVSVGTFLYMICRENIIVYDRKGTFISIKERISSNTVKSEETFINQCIKFSREMGSNKWEQKWEKVLMQYRYLNRRKNY